MTVKLVLNIILNGKTKKFKINQHSFLLYHQSVLYTFTINLGIELKYMYMLLCL